MEYEKTRSNGREHHRRFSLKKCFGKFAKVLPYPKRFTGDKPFGNKPVFRNIVKYLKNAGFYVCSFLQGLEKRLIAAGEITGRSVRRNVSVRFGRNSGYRSIRSCHPFCRLKNTVRFVEAAFIIASEFLGQVARHLVEALMTGICRVLGILTGGRGPGRKAVSAVVCTAAAAGIALFMFNVFPNAYAVELDGRQVAVVADYEDVEKEVEAYTKEISDEYANVYYTDDIAYRPVRANPEEFTPESQIRRICHQLNYMARGWRMFIDGEEVAVLQSREDGQAVIDELVDQLVPETDEEEELVIEDVKVVQDIEYREAQIEVDEFSDYEAFRRDMLVGEEVQETYVVQENDTLSEIAERKGITVDELKQLNPRHKREGNFLQIGEELVLNTIERPVQVVAEGYMVQKETIPYDTTYRDDSSMWKGQYRTVESGQSGSKEVKYSIEFENGTERDRYVVAENIVEEPRDRVVAAGTRIQAASRGAQVTASNTGGQLNWPVSGRITSPYGSRGRGFHSGIDIAARSGTPVYAAESGVVTYAGWNGGYGYLMRISHGGGMETWYAHLSRFNVSSGTRVNRGDLIAFVGNTGRSTGPHLHFEVRINGSTRNPVNYLR